MSEETAAASVVVENKPTENAAGDPVPMPSMQKAKYDWYQTQTDLVVNVLLKGIKLEQCDVNFNQTSLSVTINLGAAAGSEYSLELDLAHPIVPEKSTFRPLGTKVEIRMRKGEEFHWATLEGDGRPTTIKPSGAAVAHSYPTSSTKGPKNWDAIEREVKKEEEEEELEGDAAVNKMFQKIYRDASDDVKKAMIKSYSESGGTCLSTDWTDVGKKKLKVKPPDGMEFKKW